jgi:phospholipid/cholesterol/gamma-HCH transport system ATP-binding protein
MAGAGPRDGAAIRIKELSTRFGEVSIHDGLDLEVQRGEIMGVVGASGAGKSVLLRTAIGLNRAAGGTIEVLGRNVATRDEASQAALRMHWGVLFQDGALFSSLTVAQNIQVPMRRYLSLSRALMAELTAIKIDMVGLETDAGAKFPSELSGGMRKRAGLARALALDPEILVLDEPTAGLDPIGAAAFDSLIRNLQRALGLTVFMVTHDLDSLASICDRIAVLVDRRVIIGTMEELMQHDHPWIQDYFHGPRGRAARAG